MKCRKSQGSLHYLCFIEIEVLKVLMESTSPRKSQFKYINSKYCYILIFILAIEFSIEIVPSSKEPKFSSLKEFHSQGSSTFLS